MAYPSRPPLSVQALCSHHNPQPLGEGYHRDDGGDGEECSDDKDAGGVGAVLVEVDGHHRIGGSRRGGGHDDDQQDHGIDGDEGEDEDHCDGNRQ